MTSTSVLSSASNATISIFDTVANTAVSATKIINGIGTGANAFERMMNDMDHNHKIRSIVNQAQYEEDFLEQAAKETAKRQATLRKELDEDPVFEALFVKNYQELKALLHPVTPKE